MASVPTLTLNKFPFGIDNTQRYTYGRGTVKLSAGTYSVGGLTLSWVMNSLKVVGNPFQATFFSEGVVTSGTASITAGGFLYIYNVLTNKLQIMAASGGSTGTGKVFEEMTDGTSIPNDILNEIIAFEAIWAKNGSY